MTRALVVLAVMATACATAPPAKDTPKPSLTATAPHGPRGFVDVTQSSGITFTHHAARSSQRYLPETMGSGVAVLDFDGDGKLDLYFVDSGPVTPDDQEPGPGSNALWRNLGNWRFEDVTARAGVPGRVGGMGAAAADVDGDGDADLLVTGYRATVLYRNEGNGVFTDVTAESGVADEAWTTGAAFLDADGDGLLDLFLQRYARWSVALHRPCSQHGIETYCTPDLLDPMPSRFLRGRGDGTFEDVSKAWGVADHPGKGLGVVTTDLDGDGREDVYCANDTFANFVFVNRGRSFDEEGLVSGAGYGADGREEAGMGVDAGDLDGDALPEIAVGNFEREPTDLYRNEGRLAFTEISALSGVAGPTLPLLKFGLRIADLDLDGRDDILTANGHVYDNAHDVSPSTTFAQPTTLLLNQGSLRFAPAVQAIAGDLSKSVVGRGLVTADLDDDGDLDVVVSTNGGAPLLLRNDVPHGHWLGIACIGKRLKATAIGTRVRVTAAGRTQDKAIHGGGSYLSQSDLRLLFGLGDATSADVVVTWPGGKTQEMKAVPADAYVTITED